MILKIGEFMKILSVITSLGIAGDAMWVRISNIAKTFEINHHEVDLFHYIVKINSTKHKPILDNISKYENEYHVKSTRICNVFSIFSKYFYDFRVNKYDFIYGNTVLGAFIPVIFKKIHRVPVILDMHGLPVEESKLTGSNSYFNISFCKLLEFVTLRYSDKIFCVSNKMIQCLHIKRNVPLDKLIYIPNGVDLNFFKSPDQSKIDALKEELGIKNKFVFGYIGGFQKWQGLDNYIKAINMIPNKDVVFIIVGGDSKIIQNNLIYIPKVPQTQVPDYYSICDVLVLPRPSHIATEVAAPTKFAEYTAMGKPILTTNVGDAAEFVQQYKNGIVVENNSSEFLKKGILEFLSLDRNELLEMGDNSRILAEKEFNWETINSFGDLI